MSSTTLNEDIKNLIKRSFEGRKKPTFISGHTRIPLNIPSFGWEEIWEALESLLSTQVTMGAKVKQFESMFAEYIGVKHAIMVNSGSSANLLALSILTNPSLPGHMKPRDEVITPAVTWATTVFPIINCGLIPVLVDVDLDTFNISPEEIEKAITTKTKAIMPVHLLGNPCDMSSIMDIAQKHNLFVIEDSCEAHGAQWKGKMVGSFGDLSTFSFFFSHHITTIEGGMLLTNNDVYAEMAKALRVFGWIRDLKDKDILSNQYSEIDPRYLFINSGYNLRPTEIQGAFGIHQMPKLEHYIEIRRRNASYFSKTLGDLNNLVVHQEAEKTRHVWFAYPIIVPTTATFSRKELVNYLEAKGVETRPIMAGNIAEQPALQLFPHRQQGDLHNSQIIHSNAFLFGNHHGLGEDEKEAIANYLQEFLETH